MNNKMMESALQSMERAIYTIVAALSFLVSLAAGLTALMGILASAAIGSNEGWLNAGGVFCAYTLGPIIPCLLFVGLRQWAKTGVSELPLTTRFFPPAQMTPATSGSAEIRHMASAGTHYISPPAVVTVPAARVSPTRQAERRTSVKRLSEIEEAEKVGCRVIKISDPED